ncbi:acyltransferase [Tenacibaculum tangerinum]|uniref:Acyltransferase n=1 Tax=Tenacibaculum tangerinum TaxID=3038772 RepID=A0ABY8L7D5_9FLAO|nr:acyltransferase [Tenacibaculum tangerinum]WGH76981.1 acyltransferase [Tenacibaculum tangerinum]
MKEIKNQLRYVLPLWLVSLITSWLPDNRIVIRIRGFLMGFFLKKCGKNFTVGRDVTLLNTFNLTVGDNVYLAKGCWLNAMGGLEIEDEVVFGPYVVISTLQHTFKNKSVKQGGSIAKKVHIKKGSWLAANSSVKCGVTIGKGNLIAANSFIVDDTEDNKVLGGVPAKVIKENVDTNDTNVFYSRNKLNK